MRSSENTPNLGATSPMVKLVKIKTHTHRCGPNSIIITMIPLVDCLDLAKTYEEDEHPIRKALGFALRVFGGNGLVALPGTETYRSLN